MSLDVLVAMNDDPVRARLWDWVQGWWAEAAPDARLIVGRNADVPFNKAKAYNDAIRQATAETLMFTDADVYLPQLALMREAFAQLEQPAWMRPGTVLRLDRDTSRQVMAGSPPETYGLEGGAYTNKGLFCLVPADAVRQVRGFDERFAGWGNEDLAVRAALDTLWAPNTIHTDSAVAHLWHSRPMPRRWPGQTARHVRTREDLTRAYRQAQGDPDRMFVMVANRNRPGL